MADSSEEYSSDAAYVHGNKQALKTSYFMQSFTYFGDGAIKYLNLEAVLEGCPLSIFLMFSHGQLKLHCLKTGCLHDYNFH